MKTKKIILLLSLITLVASCSKGEKKTSAKLNLKLSGIVNLSSGIGSGGAILFGKNSAGETFGKKINTTEEDIEIPNGAWVFYALMWGSESTAMNGKVHCGKSINQLNGTATTISMSLNNANCLDPEFSGGKVYTASTLNRFADIFIEECDQIDGNTGFSCGFGNQGSAISYRFVFNNFKKNAAGEMLVGPESLVSDCKAIGATDSPSNIYSSGLPVNFPSGNGPSPFIGSIEFFMSSTNCDPADSKGVHKFRLHQGVGGATAPQHHVLVSNNTCTPSTPDFSTGTNEQKKNKCEQFLGTWNGSTCTGTFLPAVKRFAPAAVCSSQSAANVAIKHQFMLPKEVLCAPYTNNSSFFGTHPFAGGEGSAIRPYKICTEWQMNQIGEVGANASYLNGHFKLMNDLDMNKTDFGPYAKPSCVGVPSSLVDSHHNLNPISSITNDCSAEIAAEEYNGTFNGNNKTIKNGRIQAKTVDSLGMARKLGSTGKIINLNFLNLEIEGDNYVGGVAGYMNTGAEVSNIKFKDGEIRAETAYAGTVTGHLSSGAKLDLVRAHGVDIRANDFLGGLVGFNQGAISRSMFNGFIDHYNSVPASGLGGIAGTSTATGSISTSFSEGVILSSAQYTGGIVGANAGTLNHVYSTMFISSRYGNSNAAVGGIAGNSTNSGINFVYSDSVLEYNGFGTTPLIDGIVASGGIPPANLANCLSTSLTTASGCTSRTYATLRDGNNFAQPDWYNVSGAVPRLAWENESGSRACLVPANMASVGIQQAGGRGGALNPVIICTSAQLKTILGGFSSMHFKLGENVNISDWAVGDMLTSFTGVFDGGGNSLYGLNIISATNSNYGIFANNAGLIKNLGLVGNKIVHTGGIATGILTGINSGTISNIEMVGNYLDGVDNVGAIAGKNLGTINQVNVTSGLIRGQSNVGGIVGLNSGVLSRAISKINVRDLAAFPAYSKFGGVVGANEYLSIIDQTVFEGQMEFTQQASGGAEVFVDVGGIAGYNNGMIKNSITENYSTVRAKNYNHVGGFIGFNDTNGFVHTSMSLGSVIFDYTGSAIPAGKSFHQLIGSNLGNYDGDTFFLEKNAGAFIAGAQADSCDGTNIYFTTSAPSVLTSGNTSTDMIRNKNIGGGGNELRHFETYASPASNYVVTSSIACSPNSFFEMFKSYEPYSAGLATIPSLALPATFIGYDLAYTDKTVPSNSTRQEDLLEYHKALMESRAPNRPAPIWELEEGDGRPWLVQINH